MPKESVTQETTPAAMSFLQIPGTSSAVESAPGNSRVGSAASSVKSGSIHFSTTVRMLAPVIWSRIQSRRAKSVAFTTPVSFNTNDSSNDNTKGLDPLRLEEELDIQHLETLMFKFKTHIPDKVELKKWLTRRGSDYRDPTRFHSAGLMTQEEFHEMLADLLEVETWDRHKVALFEKEIGTLFKKVDIASDGLVDWDEFCTYLMLQFEENDQATKVNGNTFIPKPNIVRIDHNKETTTKILTDFNPMRYVTISKEGIIGVWSTELDLQRKIEMEHNNSDAERTSNKRHIKMWVTDAVAMPNVHKMALSTTNRDIHFYDMSTPIYTPQFHLCALGNVVLCLDYCYNKKLPAGKSMLFLGMDNGVILFLVFFTPLKGLFETPFKKTSGSHQVYLQDLPTHSRFVSCHSLGQVHSDWVRRVRYIPAKEFVISCSGSGKDSLVVRDIDDKKRKTYTFKVAKIGLAIGDIDSIRQNAEYKRLSIKIEVIHEFIEKSPLWLLHRLHQPKSVKQPNKKAKTILQKIKGLGDRLVSGQKPKYTVEDAERNLADHLTKILTSRMREQDDRISGITLEMREQRKLLELLFQRMVRKETRRTLSDD